MRRSTEKSTDKRLGELVKSRGGKYIKLSTIHETGLPDRLVVLPGRAPSFVEVKDDLKPLRPRQRIVAAELQALGQHVARIDSRVDLQAYMDSVPVLRRWEEP